MLWNCACAELMGCLIHSKVTLKVDFPCLVGCGSDKGLNVKLASV